MSNKRFIYGIKCILDSFMRIKRISHLTFGCISDGKYKRSAGNVRFWRNVFV